MKKIAFFDFDGTITTKDTMLELIKFQKGKLAFFVGFLLNAPFLVAYKLRVISNQLAKEKVMTYFFKDMPFAVFQSACDDFSDKVLPLFIRAGAGEEIDKLQQQGFEIVVVSASAENWIRKWCEKSGIKVIATQFEILNDALTGNIAGNNCHGIEKVRRINLACNLSQYDEIYCYGDTSGDKPMLALGTKAFYKPFR